VTQRLVHEVRCRYVGVRGAGFCFEITKVPKRTTSITVNYQLHEALTTKPIFLQSSIIEAKGWTSRVAGAHQRKTASVCRIAFMQGNQHAERQAGAIFRVLMSRRLLLYVIEHCNLLGMATHSLVYQLDAEVQTN